MTIDAHAYLSGLIGAQLHTLSAKPNCILSVTGGDVIVGTSKSPAGTPVPVSWSWVQRAMDQLEQDGEITIDVETVGYRSAFIGAVLSTLLGAVVLPTSPPRIRLRGTDG